MALARGVMARKERGPSILHGAPPAHYEVGEPGPAGRGAGAANVRHTGSSLSFIFNTYGGDRRGGGDSCFHELIDHLRSRNHV